MLGRRRRQTVTVLALVCLLTLGVGVAAAHQFVTFAQRPVTADSDGTARVPVNFHNTDVAVLQLTGPSGFVLTLELVDSDRDERLTLILDLGAVAHGDLGSGVTVEGGATADRRVENASGTFPAGTYNLTLSTPNGVGDATELIVPESAAVTPTATPTETTDTETTVTGESTTAQSTAAASTTAATATATTSAATTSTTTTSAATVAANGADSRGSISVFLLALFGPAVPVAVLAVASRTVG